MNTTYMQLIPSPIGTLAVFEQDQMIVRLTISSTIPENTIYSKTPLLAEAERQINEYFAGSRLAFDLPLKITGSPFALKVYKEYFSVLAKINSAGEQFVFNNACTV